MKRFAVEGTPAGWSKILPITHDLMTAGLADAEVLVGRSRLTRWRNCGDGRPGAP